MRSRAACTHTLLGGGGLVTQLCLTLGFSVHGILQARIIEVGCHFLLQGVFLTQGSTWGLLYCRWILYHGATREPCALLLCCLFVSIPDLEVGEECSIFFTRTSRSLPFLEMGGLGALNSGQHRGGLQSLAVTPGSGLPGAAARAWFLSSRCPSGEEGCSPQLTAPPRGHRDMLLLAGKAPRTAGDTLGAFPAA